VRATSEQRPSAPTDGADVPLAGEKPRSPYAPPAKAANSLGGSAGRGPAEPSAGKASSPYAPAPKAVGPLPVPHADTDTDRGAGSGAKAVEKPSRPYAPPVRSISAAATSAAPTEPVEQGDGRDETVSPYARPSQHVPGTVSVAISRASPQNPPQPTDKPRSPYAPRSARSKAGAEPSQAEAPTDALPGDEGRAPPRSSTPARRSRYPIAAERPSDRTSSDTSLHQGRPNMARGASAGPSTPGLRGADADASPIRPPASMEEAVDSTHLPREAMAEDSVDSRSPEELARLYAPAAYAEAATAPGADDATKGGQAESRPALEESRDRGAAAAPADRNAIASGFTARRGRTGPPLPDGGKLRTTRWQARDELPLG